MLIIYPTKKHNGIYNIEPVKGKPSTKLKMSTIIEGRKNNTPNIKNKVVFVLIFNFASFKIKIKITNRKKVLNT